jgi:hypothetical protein
MRMSAGEWHEARERFEGFAASNANLDASGGASGSRMEGTSIKRIR